MVTRGYGAGALTGLCPLDKIDHVLRNRNQGLSSRSELEATANPIKQGRTEIPAELREVLRHRWGCVAECLGRGRNRASLRDFKKGTQPH